MSSTESPSDRAIDAAAAGARAHANIPWIKLAKLGGATFVLAIGAYAVARDQFAIASDYAVVSAYSIPLRAPIDGIVSEHGLHVGDPVEAGDVLAEVANDLVDDRRLVDLTNHLARARAELENLKGERDSLAQMREGLERRAQAFSDASLLELRGTLSDTENSLAAAKDQRDFADRTLGRRAHLAQTGVASAADLDKAQADLSSAAHQAASQQGRLESVRARLAALENGIVLDSGANDVAYSRQRADDLDIRLTELNARTATTLADIDETSARLDAERRRFAKISATKILAPTTGTIWKVEASQGERVGAGQSVAQIVDCRTAFVIAQVPQNRMPEIEIGGEAQFRLSGEELVRTGRVSSMTSDATGGDKNLAAAPFEVNGQSATVRVEFESNDFQCFVGRTAHVLLPSAGHKVLTRLLNVFG
jgi:multidrug resistance efflux pump